MKDANFDRSTAALCDLAPAHLTDEQFTGLLLGEIPASVRAHLEACLECSREAERVSLAIGSFGRESLAWAERRAVSHPAPVGERGAWFAWIELPQRPAAWAAMAAGLALVAILGVERLGVDHRDNRAPDIETARSAAAVPPAREVTATSLKADNDLLSAIDGELRWNDANPSGVYDMKVSRSERGKSSKRVSN